MTKLQLKKHRTYRIVSVRPTSVGVQLLAMGLAPGTILYTRRVGIGGATYIMEVDNRSVVLDHTALSQVELQECAA